MNNVTKQGKYGLITGVFSPDEAREILMTLIDRKISFHQLNNFSRLERFGESGEAGEKRINELRQVKADIAELIEQARGAGRQININCDIEVALAQSWGQCEVSG